LLKNLSEYVQEEIITIRNGRMVIPVKDEHKNKVKGFIHDQSSSGFTVFIEPLETFEINNEIHSLRIEEQKEIEKILRELTDEVRKKVNEAESNFSALLEIDINHSKAKFSIKVNGAQPKISNGNYVKLINARHPLLILKENKSVVPLNIEIGEEQSSGKDFYTLVITGPNAGGKTVALKTVGLLTLMTQSGMHIPAGEYSEVSIIKKIFVDIGDKQSIENDLSTFSSRIERLKEIVLNSDENSLVLLDELGTGTDPKEGSAIAMAVLENLTNKKALTIATTHHGELKAFAFESDGMENGSMEFDEKTLQPTYNFRVGIPGSSYAFEISQRLGIPESLIKRAREFVGTEKAKLENLINDLEAKIQQNYNLKNELEKEKTQYEGLIKLYNQRAWELKKREVEAKKRALEESKRIIDNANLLVDKIIKEIKESQTEKEIRDKKKEIRDKEKEISEKIEEISDERLVIRDKRENIRIKVGDFVRLANSNSVGKVISDMDSHKNVLVEFGNIRMKVNISDIEKTEKPQNVKSSTVTINFVDSSKVKNELDLRGLTAEEAFEVTDKYLDDAYLAGWESVTLIHGKGSGALRQKLNSFLEKHPRVKSKRLGYWNEGEAGVTVVELKID
jgi:DNA mismatch repair protein MutS2